MKIVNILALCSLLSCGYFDRRVDPLDGPKDPAHDYLNSIEEIEYNSRDFTFHKKTPCMVNGIQMAIALASNEREETEYEKEHGHRNVWIYQENSSLKIGLDVKRDYKFIGSIPGKTCGSFQGAKKTRSQYVTFLFQVNNKPYQNQVVSVSYDFLNKKVNKIQKIGTYSFDTIGENFIELSTKIERKDYRPAHVQYERKDYQMAETNLRTFFTVTEEDGGAWLEVDRVKTYRMSPYKRLFRSQNEFDAFFDFNINKSSYGKQWLYGGTMKDLFCVTASAGRQSIFTPPEFRCMKN